LGVQGVLLDGTRTRYAWAGSSGSASAVRGSWGTASPPSRVCCVALAVRGAVGSHVCTPLAALCAMTRYHQCRRRHLRVCGSGPLVVLRTEWVAGFGGGFYPLGCTAATHAAHAVARCRCSAHLIDVPAFRSMSSTVFLDFQRILFSSRIVSRMAGSGSSRTQASSVCACSSTPHHSPQARCAAAGWAPSLPALAHVLHLYPANAARCEWHHRRHSRRCLRTHVRRCVAGTALSSGRWLAATNTAVPTCLALSSCCSGLPMRRLRRTL
jgi:hypothetical protein